MNEYDSNRISDLIKNFGYTKTEDINNIDCYILNTCHIREKATEKVYHDIGRLKKKYKNKKKPIVLVTGCVAQAENKEMIRRENYIDAVIGPQSYQNIPEILIRLQRNEKKLDFTDFDVIEKFDKINKLENLDSKISSYVTIQEGCDKFCNFCVVPYTRGAEYSRPMKEIVLEVKKLILNGVKEIVLLGQNVNAYNYKSNGKQLKLSNLIRELNELTNLKRIRYTTSHPIDMSDDLINCYKDVKKLVPFLHLPAQSGSNKILKKMNRKYTANEYLKIVKKLRKIYPDFEFSSDFIVGYPGEQEEDFEKTIDFIKKVKFINSYSFVYNKRPGTPAAQLESINSGVQKKRLIILQNLLDKIQIKKNKSFLGKTKKVLIENKMKSSDKFFGRTKELTPVIFENTFEKVGEIVDVEINSYNRSSLFGFAKKDDKEVAA